MYSIGDIMGTKRQLPEIHFQFIVDEKGKKLQQ